MVDIYETTATTNYALFNLGFHDKNIAPRRVSPPLRLKTGRLLAVRGFTWLKGNHKVAKIMKDVMAAGLTVVAVVLSANTVAPEIRLLFCMAVVLRLLGSSSFILIAALLSAGVIAVFQYVSQGHMDLAGILTFDLGSAILLLCFPARRGRASSTNVLIEAQERCKGEDDLRRVIDTIPALVWCTCSDGGPAFVNKRMAEYVGISEQDFCNQSTGMNGMSDVSTAWMKQLLHPEDYEAARDAWINALTTGQPYRSVHRIRRADGVYRWFQSMGEPVRDETGVVARWYGINVDIEDARQNEEWLGEAQEKHPRTVR